MTDRLALSVKEAAEAVGCSERMFRGMVARREVPSVRFGRRVLIPVDALRTWLAERILPSAGERCEEKAGAEGTREREVRDGGRDRS